MKRSELSAKPTAGKIRWPRPGPGEIEMAKMLSLAACAFPAALTRGTLGWAALVVLAPSGIAQLQFDDLRKQHLLPDSDRTGALALGDVDGDGDSDLIFGNAFSGQQNRLYLNDGTGTFPDATAARMPPDSDYTQSVALGDVDGDGDPDLVFGKSGLTNSQNRLYLNDGTGTFTDATVARMPHDTYNTSAVALGDVDGDQTAVLRNCCGRATARKTFRRGALGVC